MIEQEALSQRIYQLCCRIREQRPLVHVVTNFVVMNQTANALLAMGAAPTMSWAKEDAAYMSKISDALCINIGTPVCDRIEVMKNLMLFAQETGKPVVLDPVGSGAGDYRTGIARQLFSLAPDKIIRGNASEVCSLVDENRTTRGVDNGVSLEDAKQILLGHGRTNEQTEGGPGDAEPGDAEPGFASILQFASSLIVSGQKDMIMAPEKVLTLANGSPLMGHVTGTGCILSAVTAAFYAVSDNGFEACVAAASVVGIAGELAAQKASGPGTFMAHFLDYLYALDQKMISNELKVASQVPETI